MRALGEKVKSKPKEIRKVLSPRHDESKLARHRSVLAHAVALQTVADLCADIFRGGEQNLEENADLQYVRSAKEQLNAELEVLKKA